MADWKIDARLCEVTSPHGCKVRLSYVFISDKVGHGWMVCHNPHDANADDAWVKWNDALDAGVEALTRAGTTCFGKDWIVPMSNALGVGRAAIYRWLSKERPLTAPVWRDLENVVAKCQMDTQDNADAIKEFQKGLPAIGKKK